MSELNPCVQAVFTPGGSTPAIVLFRTEHPTTQALNAKFEDMAWPSGYRVCTIDVAQQEDVCGWFSPSEAPAVAVVFDGVILALEHDCTVDACRRLLRVAAAQRSRLNEI